MVILTSKTFKILKVSNFTGLIYYNNFKVFKSRCMSHKYYGPAYIWSDGEKEWNFNDKCFGFSCEDYNQKQFLKDLNRKWLL